MGCVTLARALPASSRGWLGKMLKTPLALFRKPRVLLEERRPREERDGRGAGGERGPSPFSNVADERAPQN